MKAVRLNRVVIKEELVALTGDFKLALVLNQMIYWSERVIDADKFIKEEKERMERNNEDPNIELSKGWIYKTADELAEETMMGVSSTSIRKYLKELVEMGFLMERNNPKYKWDRTFQYRVNLLYIDKKLKEIGYNLDGYSFQESCDGFQESCDERQESCDRTIKKLAAITETTTETTYKDIKEGKTSSANNKLFETNNKPKTKKDTKFTILERMIINITDDIDITNSIVKYLSFRITRTLNEAQWKLILDNLGKYIKQNSKQEVINQIELAYTSSWNNIIFPNMLKENSSYQRKSFDNTSSNNIEQVADNLARNKDGTLQEF